MTSTQLDRLPAAIPVRVFSTPLTVCQLTTADAWGFVESAVPSQAVTAVLPPNSGPYTIFDGLGQAATYPITIENASGGTVGTISAAFGSMSFAWDGTAMRQVTAQGTSAVISAAMQPVVSAASTSLGLEAAGFSASVLTALLQASVSAVLGSLGAAALAGNAAQGFLVANATAGTQGALPIAQGDARYAGASRTVTFTTGGTWTAPDGVSQVVVSGIGGGGGGGGGNATYGSGSGGGSGAVAFKQVHSVVPGTPYTVTIGAAGVGSSGANGSAGGPTFFATLLTLLGGGGGVAPAAYGGLVGGAAGGAGGQPGGPAQNASGAVLGGGGGGSVFGPGGAPAKGGAVMPPTAGGGFGAGGGGGGEASLTGASGSSGVLILEW